METVEQSAGVAVRVGLSSFASTTWVAKENSINSRSVEGRPSTDGLSTPVSPPGSRFSVRIATSEKDREGSALISKLVDLFHSPFPLKTGHLLTEDDANLLRGQPLLTDLGQVLTKLPLSFFETRTRHVNRPCFRL